MSHWFRHSSWESLEGKGGGKILQKKTKQNKTKKTKRERERERERERRKKTRSKTKQYVHGSPQRESIKWIPVMEVRGRQNSNANNLNSRDLVL